MALFRCIVAEAKISQLEKELENANDLLAAARQRGKGSLRLLPSHQLVNSTQQHLH